MNVTNSVTCTVRDILASRTMERVRKDVHLIITGITVSTSVVLNVALEIATDIQVFVVDAMQDTSAPLAAKVAVLTVTQEHAINRLETVMEDVNRTGREHIVTVSVIFHIYLYD